MKTPEHRKRMAQLVISVTAAVFLIWGIARGEMAIVLKKAANICMECIGLG